MKTFCVLLLLLLQLILQTQSLIVYNWGKKHLTPEDAREAALGRAAAADVDLKNEKDLDNLLFYGRQPQAALTAPENDGVDKDKLFFYSRRKRDDETLSDEQNRLKQSMKTSYKNVKGVYHGPDAFIPNTKLLFGGDWGKIASVDHIHGQDNDTPTSTTNHCNFNDNPLCTMETLNGERKQCFQHNQEGLTEFAKEILYKNNSSGDVKLWHPDKGYKKLPFPKTFNVTVISTNAMRGCEDGQISCHESIHKKCPIYVCHSLVNTTTFTVRIQSKDSPPFRFSHKLIQMTVVCHYDTRDWDVDHPAFLSTGKKPGDVICHFMPDKHFVICKK